MIPDDETARTWLLHVRLAYENHPAGDMRFTLHNYSQAEARAIASNIRSNPFLMREIDEYLWSESD